MSDQPDLIEQIMDICWDIANDPGGRMFNGGDEDTRAELTGLLARAGWTDPAEAERLRAELASYARLLLSRPQDVPVADVAWKLRQIIGEDHHD